MVGIDEQLQIEKFNFDDMQRVVEKYNIPSEHFGEIEELLLGRILQDVENAPDNDVWEYSPGTQQGSRSLCKGARLSAPNSFARAPLWR